MNDLLQKLRPKSETVNNLLTAGAITFIVMVFTVLVLGCQYQTNDDYAISLTVSGAYGEISERMVFSNTILGILLKLLYMEAPSINWYIWMHLAILFCASTACIYLILETVRKKIRILIALFFAGVAILPAIMVIQFTMQAYFCVIAGFGLFAYAFLKPELQKNRKKRIFTLIISVILCLLGVMIRDKAILTIIPFFIALAGYLFLKKKDRRPLLWMLIGCIICAGSLFVNAYSYHSEKWQEYQRFNSIRSTLLDMPQLSYEDNIEVFEAVGWSVNDYNMFYQWLLADDENFTTEKLEYITEHASWPAVTIPKIISSYVSSMNSVLMFFPFCILILCLGLCLRTRDKQLLPVLVASVVILIHIGFVFMQRAPIRTVYPHYVLGILLLLVLIDYSKFRIPIRKRDIGYGRKRIYNISGGVILGICMAIILIMNTAIADRRASTGTERYAHALQLDLYVKDNKDKVFLSTVRAGSARYGAYSVFYAPRKGMLDNYSMLGGWYTKTPRYYEFMETNGIENMFLSLVDENVFLIEIGKPILIQQYLFENFQLQTQPVLMVQFGDICVYKLCMVV